MMHSLLKKRKIVYSCIVLSFLSITIGYILTPDKTVEQQEVIYDEAQNGWREQVVILPEESFWEEDFMVEISTMEEENPIYFTLDGSVPNAESDCYKEPLCFNRTSEMQVIVIRASVLEDDGELSKPVTKTYFVGENLNERFSTHVVSIVTDESNLYDYEKGI